MPNPICPPCRLCGEPATGIRLAGQIGLHEDDSAKIDGCGFLGIYWRMLLPLSKPALGMVAVFSFQGRWRDFMSPLIYINTMERYTVAMGLNL